MRGLLNGGGIYCHGLNRENYQYNSKKLFYFCSYEGFESFVAKVTGAFPLKMQGAFIHDIITNLLYLSGNIWQNSKKINYPAEER
jgi:hypothetical protein